MSRESAGEGRPGGARDDFVYIHYSGHGSQQPAIEAGSETDGLDEIVLPRGASGCG